MSEERVPGMRFGIGTNTDHTLEEAWQRFSVTRERIRQAFAGEGASEARASVAVAEDAVVPRSVNAGRIGRHALATGLLLLAACSGDAPPNVETLALLGL